MVQEEHEEEPSGDEEGSHIDRRQGSVRDARNAWSVGALPGVTASATSRITLRGLKRKMGGEQRRKEEAWRSYKDDTLEESKTVTHGLWIRIVFTGLGRKQYLDTATDAAVVGSSDTSQDSACIVVQYRTVP